MKKPVYDSARVTPPDNEILIQSLAYKRERVARADAKADLLTNELLSTFKQTVYYEREQTTRYILLIHIILSSHYSYEF